ncbi:MAG: 4Fe-4S binding protein [Chitinophagales bacterium]
MVAFLATVVHNLLSAPATRLDQETAAPGRRGRVGIDLTDCLYCGLCQRRCPAACLAVDRTARTFTLEASRCILCGACTEACPKRCLTMKEEGRAPVTDKERLAEKGAPSRPAVA